MKFSLFKKTAPAEERSATQSDPDFFERLGLNTGHVSSQDVVVTTETALMVPAVWAAVNFISGTLAGLPLKVYRKTKSGREEVSGGLSDILGTAPNDEWTSFDWRKYKFDGVLTGGRGFTYIERNNAGRVSNLWPMEPSRTTVKSDGMRREYHYRSSDQKTVRYTSQEVIDVPFMLRSDMTGHRGPIASGRDAIGMAIAAVNYASKTFQSGGLPPSTLEGPFANAGAAGRASDDIARQMAKLAAEGKSVLAIPSGHTLNGLGFSADKMQLIELQRFSIEQVARIYSLPPAFLQDLTHGTFSNTEQQDLQFVKHTLKRWIEQTEQQMNLKLFGRSSKNYIEFNVDGLLRGDIKTRMEAHGHAIQNGIYTPAHAAAKENAPFREEADVIVIQGGTVPIGTQPQKGESDE